MDKNNIDSEWLNNHITKLNLNNTENEAVLSSSSGTDETVNKSKDLLTNEITDNIKINNHDNIFSDELLYKKPWTKLNSIHKILKIKEFVNSLKFNIEEKRNKLKDDLILLVKSKVLTKKDSINYDEINGKIISIKNLEYKNGNYIYN
jgi:hypothetical protein